MTLRNVRDNLFRIAPLHAFTACAVFGFAGHALAQDEAAPKDDAPAAESTPAADVELPGALSKEDEAPRRWLMREGSLLVQARGTMDRDPDTGWWRFTLRTDEKSKVTQTLGLLPCSLLGEMVRIASSLDGRTVVFEVTGQIYVYRGKNFLLPTIAPQLIEYGPSAKPADDAATDSTTNADEAPASDRNDDSAEDIIEELESAVGALARGAAPIEPGSSASGNASLVREQTMLLSRRGQVTRTNTGAWMFVFDADAQGLADPPMILMPCLLLEQLEQRTWRSGASVPVLVSGRAFVFEDRNYLLPTSFQIARERTPMTQ